MLGVDGANGGPMGGGEGPTSALQLTTTILRSHCKELLGILKDANFAFVMPPVPPTEDTETESWKWTPDSKLCFVTTGATAPFTALIESVLSIPTIEALLSDGYTHLLIQYGSAKDVFTKSSHTARAHLKQSSPNPSLTISGIDFSPDGLQSQFKLVQRSHGLVISHAGTSHPTVHSR